jgi:hypothetical protein
VDVDKLRRIKERADRKVQTSADEAKHRLYRPVYERRLLSMTPEQVEELKAGKTPEQAEELDERIESLRKRYGG